jgi:flagellar biosynthetic protein FliO
VSSAFSYQSTLSVVGDETVKFATHQWSTAAVLATFSASAFGNSAADDSSLTATLFVPLILILAAAAAATWFLRRWKGSLGRRDGPLQVVHVIALGPRERMALVKVGSRYLVVGITSTSINTLAQMSDTEGATLEVVSSADTTAAERTPIT